MNASEARRPINAGVLAVALVDDDPWLRRTLAIFLATQRQLRVIWEAGSAEEALARIEAQPPDLLLLDIDLPGMSGLEATDRLRGGRPDLRVVIVSTHTEAEYADLERRANIDGFVRKDALASGLRASLSRIGIALA